MSLWLTGKTPKLVEATHRLEAEPPEILRWLAGKAKPFRSSGGEAAIRDEATTEKQSFFRSSGGGAARRDEATTEK